MPIRSSLASAALAGVLALGAGSVVMFGAAPALSAEQAVRVPPPALDPADAGASRTAVFAGGCFWGVQGVFQHVKGVSSAISGYTGGAAGTARYERVSDGDTGHAEAVRVTYDPRIVSYGRLLQIYFSVVADPTQLNRQGPDTGTQYRSAFFPQSETQRRVAVGYITQLDAAHVWRKPIVTRIERAQAFYPAEAHHQDFLTLNPNHPYIAYNDIPKVTALKSFFPGAWRPTPVLVRRGSGA